MQLVCLEEKYEECVAMLRETQQEVKCVRKNTNPSVIHQHYGTSAFFLPEGSLAAEIEKSTRRESSQDRRCAPTEQHLCNSCCEGARIEPIIA